MITYTSNKQLQQSGFSLVETLVAITILLIVIVGPLSISSQTAESTSFASEQVIASFLAQEGVELIHKERDEFFLNAIANDTTDVVWGQFLNELEDADTFACINNANGCGVYLSDTGDLAVVNGGCGANGCPIFLDPNPNTPPRAKYTHDGTIPNRESTPYSRAIRVTRVPPLTGNQILIESEVSWRSNNTRDRQSVVVSTYLFNTYGE